MQSKQLKHSARLKNLSDRPWGVQYLIENGHVLGLEEFYIEYYRTKIGAILAIYFKFVSAPKGGTVKLFRNERNINGTE